MINLVRSLLLVLVPLMPCVLTQGTYTITAPNTIRPNAGTTVAVTYNCQYLISTSLSIVARITGEVNKIVYKIDQSANVPPRETRILQFKIGNWPQGNYRLEVNGSGTDLKFQRTVNLNFNSKQFSLLIDMDKSLYQLSQLVHFRVVAINPELLPYKNQSLSVFINDAQNNRIKQWDSVLPKNGLFEGSLQLSSQPIKGQWTISASAKDVTATETFEVSEYTLPRFDLIVDPPPYITTADKTFIINLKAAYTFGGDVPGTYVINVSESYCVNQFSSCRSRPVSVTGRFSGTVKVPITVSDLNLGDTSGNSLTVVAVVTEQFTGIQRTDTATFTRYQNAEQLTIVQDQVYKPKFPFLITVRLLTQNGLPVTNATGQVNVTYNFYADNAVLPQTTTRLNFKIDGSASLNITPPLFTQSLSVTASYKDLTAYGYAQAAQSLSEKFITISVNANKPKVGDLITVKVAATFKLETTISYQVVGRGNILIAKNVRILVPSETAEFSFSLTRSMTPHVRIVVVYASSCGELVGDSLDLTVDGALQTPLTLQFSNTTVEPGDNITLKVTSRPSTYVALKAVDKSVLLLSNGIDITQEDIYNELQQYDIGVSTSYGVDQLYFPGIIRRPLSSGTFDEIFQYAGLVLLTNGLYYKATSCAYPLYLQKGGGDIMVPLNLVQPAASFVEPTRVRKFFPEVWIWQNVTTSSAGVTELILTVPDTITTWILRGFAISDTYGLGATDKPTNLTVFRPFFLVANLPYSVIRTEVFTLQVMVFNYLSQDLSPVIVSLTKTGIVSEYDFVEPTLLNNSLVLQKNVTVRSNDIQIVTFRIRPTVVGYIDLNIKAVSPYAGDALLVNLLVKAEGSPQFFSNSKFLDLRSNPGGVSIGTSISVNTSVTIQARRSITITTNIQINVSSDAVPGSEFIEFSVVGDIMASVIANLKNLIRLPSGCGEQNMINFVPNVVVIIYLEVTFSLTVEIKTTTINYLELGYQNQLNFKRSDGSFSAWGQRDPQGSTWLTAYVLRFFVLATRYITIDSNVIDKARQFLISKQLPSGEFVEDGRVIHNELLGGTGKGLGLSAFVLLALLQDQVVEQPRVRRDSPQQNNSDLDNAIIKGRGFLESNLNSINSTFDLTLVTYVLHLTNSTLKDNAFAKLVNAKTVEGDLTYWHTASSNDVEATGYALLTYSVRKNAAFSDYFPIVRWLVSQRNGLGSYSSSQDTVVAIQALAAVAPTLLAPKNSSVRVIVSYFPGPPQTYIFNVNSKNALVLQKQQLPKEVRNVGITATGDGVAIAQVSWNYNVVKKNTTSNSFRINVVVDRKSNVSYSINVCTSYLLSGTTNMALVEIAALSGYIFYGESIPTPGSIPGLKGVDNTQSNTLIVLYFDSLPSVPNQLCVSLTATQTNLVEELKDAIVSVYDYYETSKRGEAFYNLPKSK